MLPLRFNSKGRPIAVSRLIEREGDSVDYEKVENTPILLALTAKMKNWLDELCRIVFVVGQRCQRMRRRSVLELYRTSFWLQFAPLQSDSRGTPNKSVGRLEAQLETLTQKLVDTRELFAIYKKKVEKGQSEVHDCLTAGVDMR